MARDDDTRILQYQNRDETIHVTHIVPYGSIPWTPDKDARRVSFLKAHAVTVLDSEGYHNYHVDPKYKFEDLDSCAKFQSTLRERELCGAFDAVEIAESGTIIARRQVIRLWKKRRPNQEAIATMTLFQSSIEGQGHKEVELVDYMAGAVFHVQMFRRQNESDTLDIVPSISPVAPRRGVRILRVKFGSIQGSHKSSTPCAGAQAEQLTVRLVPKMRDSSSNGFFYSILQPYNLATTGRPTHSPGSLHLISGNRLPNRVLRLYAPPLCLRKRHSPRQHQPLLITPGTQQRPLSLKRDSVSKDFMSGGVFMMPCRRMIGMVRTVDKQKALTMVEFRRRQQAQTSFTSR